MRAIFECHGMLEDNSQLANGGKHGFNLNRGLSVPGQSTHLLLFVRYFRTAWEARAPRQPRATGEVDEMGDVKHVRYNVCLPD